MLLKDLPHDARPREKLLALLLRTGLPGKNALQMGQELVDTFGGIGGLLHTSADALKKIKGLGPAKRAEIVAVLELARRALASQLQEKTMFSNPQAIRDYLQLQLGGRDHEIFAVLFLDTSHRLIVLEEMFRGTLTQTSVYPREVVVRALALNAANVVFAHNHPSGIAQPSRADESITQTLKAALALVDVRVLDHFIVTATSSASMAELGLI